MNSHEFLEAVLPSTGKYCVAVIHPPEKNQYFLDNTDAVDATAVLHDIAGKNTYYALASFAANNRQAANAQQMRSLFIDIDCGAARKYQNKRSAVEALMVFLQDTKLAALGEPWVVDSGGGVHVYWPLDEDVDIDVWKPVAESMKRAAKHYDFDIDMTVTADAARVLRLPGTHNYKYTPPRLVSVKKTGGIFKLADIGQTLAPFKTAVATSTALVIPGVPLKAMKPGAVATALMANSVTVFKNILVKTVNGAGCGQLKYYIENAKAEGMEPLWRGVLSIAKPCIDGTTSARRLSLMHPYDEDRMQSKLAEIKGPYPCTKFDTENPGVCGKCQFWGKITNPLALGREVDSVTVATEIPVSDDDGIVHETITRPTPPRGFSYGRNGGVYMQKREAVDGGEVTTVEIMLIPFDFFMIDMLVEDGVYTSRFLSIKNGQQFIVTIPNKAITSRDNTMAVLASQNVVASFGAANDKNLYDYVRASIGEASAVDNALIVPPNFGWQDTGGFALGDTMYQPDGRDYTFVSQRLVNIVNLTKPKGDLAVWRNIMHMMAAKQMWGHMTAIGIGFGSALMDMAPAGAKAMTWHFASKESGVGKSLALGVCNSVWGHPLNYAVVPATSERTMLQRAGFLGSLPLALDEITTKMNADKEWGPNHIFDYSQGGHKLKGSGSANAELRDDLKWAGFCVMTANTPIFESMMGARDTTSNGEAYRLLEWRPESTKLIWTPAERETRQQLEHNYGVAGHTFAKWLSRNRPVAQAVLASVMEQWRAELYASDEERFWTSGCSCVIAGLLLAGPKYANIIDIPIAPVTAFLRQRVKEARRIINTNKQYSTDILNSYIRENIGGFVKLESPTAVSAIFTNGQAVRPDTTRGAIRGRVEYNVTPGWTDTFIEVTMLKRYCAARNQSYMEFLREIERTSTVTEVRKNMLQDTKSPPMRVQCLKISAPNERVDAE